MIACWWRRSCLRPLGELRFIEDRVVQGVAVSDHVDERQRDQPTDAHVGAGRVGCGWSASEFDAVVDLGVLGDEPGALVDSELFARAIGVDPEAGPSVALVLRGPERV